MKRIENKGFGVIPTFLVLTVVVAVIVASYFLIKSRQSARTLEGNDNNEISSFEECVNAGNPVMESFPGQCSYNGKTFTNTMTKHVIADEGLTVAYAPADWPEIEPYNENVGGRKTAGISLRSEIFYLNFAFGQEGKGGFTCFDTADFNPDLCKSESKVVQTIRLNNQPVNIIAHMHKEPDSPASYRLFLTDKTECKDSFSCTFPAVNPVFQNNSSVIAGYSDDRTFAGFEDFLQQEEVKRALEILTSANY